MVSLNRHYSLNYPVLSPLRANSVNLFEIHCDVSDCARLKLWRFPSQYAAFDWRKTAASQ